MLEEVRKVYGKVTRTAMLVCMLCIVVMMAYGFGDVFARYLFNRPFTGTFELSELLMVAVVFLSLASCQAEGRHMRVDFLSNVAGKRAQEVLDGIAYICGIAACGMIAWSAFPIAWDSWRIHEVTEGIASFPVYPFKFIVVIGVVLLGFQLILQLAEMITGRTHLNHQEDT